MPGEYEVSYPSSSCLFHEKEPQSRFNLLSPTANRCPSLAKCSSFVYWMVELPTTKELSNFIFCLLCRRDSLPFRHFWNTPCAPLYAEMISAITATTSNPDILQVGYQGMFNKAVIAGPCCSRGKGRTQNCINLEDQEIEEEFSNGLSRHFS